MIVDMEKADETRQLVLRARAGSRDAFAELVRHNHVAVRTYLGRFLADAATVDDLAQDVFLVAFQRLDEFRGDAPFLSWLLGIARNQVRHFLRTESRRRERDRQAFGELLEQWQAERLGDHGPQEDEHQRTLEALRACLEQLPPSSRTAVQSFYFDRQSTDAIARQLNKSGGAIRMLLSRTRQALATCIGRRLQTDRSD